MNKITPSLTIGLESLKSAWDNIDVRSGLPAEVTHVSGQRLQPLCRKLQIEFAVALVGWGGTRRYPKPEFDGVVVLKRDARKLKAEIKKRAARNSPEVQERRRAYRERKEEEYRDHFAAEIRDRFPFAPVGIEDRIAERACEVGSRRVGRSSTVSDPVNAAVVACIRHECTDYDAMLSAAREEANLEFDRYERRIAREQAREITRARVAGQVRRVLAQWQGSLVEVPDQEDTGGDQ